MPLERLVPDESLPADTALELDAFVDFSDGIHVESLIITIWLDSESTYSESSLSSLKVGAERAPLLPGKWEIKLASRGLNYPILDYS